MKLATAPFKNWGVLATRMAGRTSKQCRERWCHHLNPAINKGAYTEKEDQIIIDTQAELGNKWSLIAARLPGRTENSIKIRCKALLRKVAPGGGGDGGGSGGGGGGGKSAPASPRPAKKSSGTSTSSTRQSQCGAGGRSLPASSCFSPTTSASASSSCASELNGMAEQSLLNGLDGGGGDCGRGIPSHAAPQQQYLPREKFSSSRGLKFESSSVADTQAMMFPDMQAAASFRAAPSHGVGTGFELGGVVNGTTKSGTSGQNGARAAASSASEQDSRWRLGPKQDTTSFMSSLSLAGVPIPEGVLFPNGQQQRQRQQQQQQQQQQQLQQQQQQQQQLQQQQQHFLSHPGEFVDFIPADVSFPNAFSGGGHGNSNSNCSGVVLDSSSAPAGGFVVQPQLMAPQPQDQTPLGYSDFVPTSTPLMGSALEQAYLNHRQANPCVGALDFGEGELVSSTVAAAVVTSGFSAAGVANSNHGSSANSRGLASPGSFGPSDFGQHVDNDLRAVAAEDGGGEAGGGGGGEQGPIKECCSFLDLANAASADDNLVGEVCPWQG
ncbi:unnamed protein product [Scytosiphon promiscuus]